MASAGGSSYINKIVSLISVSNIRYEGTISAIDNDTITLKNGRGKRRKIISSAHFWNGESRVLRVHWRAEGNEASHLVHTIGNSVH